MIYKDFYLTFILFCYHFIKVTLERFKKDMATLGIWMESMQFYW